MFGIIEAATLGLTTIWFAAGALIAMISAMLNLPLIGQVIVFLISSAVLLYFTRPLVKEYLKIGSTKTNVNSIIGEVGIVTEKILPFNTGQVKVSGQIWTARSNNNEELDENTRVEIIKVEGVKLIVKKIN